MTTFWGREGGQFFKGQFSGGSISTEPLNNRVSAEKERLSWRMNNLASNCWTMVRVTVEQSCQLLLNNRVSDSWTTVCWTNVPVTLEQLFPRLQKGKMDVWYNINISTALDFQIIYYVQYQLHKVFPSVPTKGERRVPEALLTQRLPFFSSDSFLAYEQSPPRNVVLGYDFLI